MSPPDLRPELGEFGALQWTRTELCRSLRAYFAGPGPDAVTGLGPVAVGTDVVFCYDPGDRLARITPDVYLIEGLAPGEQLRCYRLWERGGLAPSLAVHVVEGPVAPEDGLMMHFYRLGLSEVVLYDPFWYLQPPASPTGRRLLTHYRRGAQKFALCQQEHPGRVRLPRYGFTILHLGGARLDISQL